MDARVALGWVLLALAALYAAWFGMRAEWTALAVFALPPLLLGVACLRTRWRAPFWAGVCALGWFAHGVMVAWSRPGERGFALAAVALALAVVWFASLPGLRARVLRRTPR